MRRPRVCVRLDPDDLERARGLVERLRRAGVEATLSGVLRVAVAFGLSVVEADVDDLERRRALRRLLWEVDRDGGQGEDS